MIKRILFFLLILLFLLPKIASLHVVRDVLVAQLNKKLEGTITIEDLSLNWFGPQVLTGFQYRNISGNLLIEAQALRFNIELLNLYQSMKEGNCNLTLTVEEYTLFEHLIKGKDPMEIALENCQLQPLRVGKGTLLVGKVLFVNGKPLRPLLKLLKLSAKENILVWMTPIYFNLHKNNIHIERADLLALGTTHLAVWGSVNLKKDEMFLKLGVPNTLLGIKNGQEMSVIPLKGTNQGLILNDKMALDHLAKFLLGENKLPKPTTTPFPWEK